MERQERQERTKETQLVIDNLKLAINILRNTPDNKLNLRAYRTTSQCGTIHCAIGELSNHDHFAAQGVQLVRAGGGWILLNNDEQQVYQPGHHMWLDALFGPRAWKALFEQRGYGLFDDDLLELHYEQTDNIGTDKDLAILRLERQLGGVLHFGLNPNQND